MKILAITLIFLASNAFALELNSGSTKATVVELYTSEGCSSCPPADRWLANLKEDERLFKQVIPMAFHVDYWDQLGWKDPWAKAAFSQRQRQLALTATTSAAFVGLFSQVYTPAVLLAGNEWTSWRRYNRIPEIPLVKTGVLSATLMGSELKVNYSEQGQYELNIAYLGMNLESKVTAGENRSRQLVHDFVVLTHSQTNGEGTWQVSLPAIPQVGQTKTAISIWVTKVDSLDIEQATAAYLD